ncbi:helix-turn-helix transcriptional regulator [Bacillus sp. FSL R9-9863]|uniref:helix-turn-helix domain-containing protein n=1 Tax=unclassified Bacillus (in: firmicutes) TaxID=185979 RepID=UPI0008FE60F2|nr:helix-turn-helix transcriptional regulator [Bacillus sp. L27]OJD46823.1 helix-turn-helix transcriptional regulator [Bacillus sp. L27]
MKEKAYQSKPLLTKREREVFELLVQDKTTKEIAGELFISEKTVRNHISNVMCRDCKENNILYCFGKRKILIIN